MKNYVLLIDCPDQKGLVHLVTGVLYRHALNVTRNDEFVEKDTNHFFMRTAFAGDAFVESILAELQTILPTAANIRLSEQKKKNIIILATKEHHCVGEILSRHYFEELNANVMAVVANHATLQDFVEKFSVPFYFLSHENKSREDHENEILSFLTRYQADYLVLAKFMRVLTPDFIRRYPQRIINIHHSFLPAFVGANPYRQAYNRGVKIIGATAHFVNEALDEGPIITQNIIHVDHSHSAAEMAQAGRNVEKITLVNALDLVFTDKVFIKGNRTVIFD